MNFKYKAIDTEGNIVTGDIKSDTRAGVLAELRAKKLTVLDMKAEQPSKPKRESPLAFRFSGRITQSHVAFFTRQLAELLDAGIPLVELLDSMTKFSTSDRFRVVIEEVSQAIQKGKGLSEALDGHPDIFSDLYRSMVRVGEASGTISIIFNRLADHMEKDLELKNKVRAALTYPVFLLVFCMVLVYGMVNFLLPGFMPMWEQAGLDLSQYPITQFLVRLSNLSRGRWDEVLVFILILLLLKLLHSVARTPDGVRFTDRTLLKLPWLGAFLRLTVLARAANTLAILASSGVPFIQSVRLAADTSGNIHIKEALEQVALSMEGGKNMVAAFEDSDILPPLMLQMVAVGQKSGDLSSMLVRIGHYYEKQLEAGIRTFSTLLEPVTMVVIGGIVFFFVLGVFLPLMGVVGALQSQM